MASYRARNEARCTSSGRTARFHSPNWYTRNPRHTLAAQYAEVTAPFWLVPILARGQGIEARLLLIVEQGIEFCERRSHGAHGLQHCGKAHMHASIRPVGVLGRSVGHPALSRLTALAMAVLSSSSAARCASSGSTSCAISLMRQSVTPAVWPAQRPLLTSAPGRPTKQGQFLIQRNREQFRIRRH